MEVHVGRLLIFLLGFALLFALLWALFLAVVPLMQRLLSKSAHWTTKFRYRDYVPVGVLLVAGIAATLIAGDQFIDLAEALHDSSPKLQLVDREVHDWARTTYTPGSTAFFTTMTIIGTPWVLGALVVATGIGLAVRGRWRWLLFLVFTTGVGALLNVALKLFFARARPDLTEALRQAHGYSFPSGHAMGSTIVFGALSYLAFRAVRAWKLKAAALAFSTTMTVSIALSRIYLGVHWISDIAAGISAGLLWIAVTIVAYESFRRIRAIRSLRRKRTA